jgi:hypothetical protein
VVEGAGNSGLFNMFLEDLLAEMNPYPAKNSVLILDNVAFHHNPEVLAMAAAK